jgi:hypothetical protein
MPTYDNRVLSSEGVPAIPATTTAIAPAVETYLLANPPAVGDGSVTLAKLAIEVTDEIDAKADGGSTTTALAGKAPAASPTFTGTVIVPDNSFTIAKVNGLQAALDAKQATLVSATNIKTINGTTILGSGDMVVGGGSGPTALKKTSTQVINGTGFVDVSGMTFAVVSGTTYFYDFYIVFRSTLATGFRFSVNCPTGALDYMRQYQTVANSDLVGVATWLEGHAVNRDVGTVTTASIAAGVDLVCRIQGSYVCTQNGTFALRAASETANTDLVIQRACCTYF